MNKLDLSILKYICSHNNVTEDIILRKIVNRKTDENSVKASLWNLSVNNDYIRLVDGAYVHTDRGGREAASSYIETKEKRKWFLIGFLCDAGITFIGIGLSQLIMFITQGI